jgi:mono/diheme cytochrome c family protein
VDYVMMLSFRGQFEFVAIEELSPQFDEDEPLDPLDMEDSLVAIAETWDMADSQIVFPASLRPPFDEDSIRRGREAFLDPELGCAKCHGADGRGHTQENVGQDPWGNEVQAADLTSGMLRGGRRPADIYRRIHSGVNPMPAFGEAFPEDPEMLWHLVHFVLAVAEGRPLPDVEIPALEETDLDELGDGDAAQVPAEPEDLEPDDAEPDDAAEQDDAGQDDLETRDN